MSRECKYRVVWTSFEKRRPRQRRSRMAGVLPRSRAGRSDATPLRNRRSWLASCQGRAPGTACRAPTKSNKCRGIAKQRMCHAKVCGATCKPKSATSGAATPSMCAGRSGATPLRNHRSWLTSCQGRAPGTACRAPTKPTASGAESLRLEVEDFFGVGLIELLLVGGADG